MQFSKNLEDNLEHLKQTLSLEKNFDVVYRVVSIGGKKGCLLFVDGLTKDEVLLKILQAWWSIKPEDLPADANGFSGKYMPYGEVGLIANEEDMIVQLLSGITAVLIDGYDKCMMIDCRTYPGPRRGRAEKDKVLRGSGMALVETLIFNTALIRRRIPGSEADHGNFKRRQQLPHGHCGLLYGRKGG